MGQGGRDFTFQSSLSSLAVSDFFPCGFFYLFYSLKSSYVPVLAGQGLADSVINKPPYSVREWCRFLTKLSRLLSKSDCFQPVSFDTLCNPQFRCRGVSIISFACVMTDSITFKNSQTAAEGVNYEFCLCEMTDSMSFSIYLVKVIVFNLCYLAFSGTANSVIWGVNC